MSARMRPQGSSSAYAPNKMAQELALLKQPSPRGRYGAPAPPHPKAVMHTEETTSKEELQFFWFLRPRQTHPPCHFESYEKS